MNKNILLLLLLIVLGGLAWFGYSNGKSKSSSIDISDREFAIESKEDIYRIKLTERTGDKIEMTRKDNAWYVGEDPHKVSDNTIGNILSVMKNLQIKYIPPTKYHRKIINEINRIGIQVDLYDKSDDLMKSYFVGGNVQDGGTYFVMQGKNTPYVLERKFGYGSVRDIFIYEEMDLYDKTMVTWDPSDINYVSIEYPKDKPNSFILQKKIGSYEVTPFYETTRVKPGFLQDNAKAYVQGFDKLISEANENDNEIINKLSDIVPFAIANIKTDDRDQTLTFYPVVNFMDQHEDLNALEKINLTYVERFFVLTSWGDLYVAQKQLIQKIFRGYPYFYES